MDTRQLHSSYTEDISIAKSMIFGQLAGVATLFLEFNVMAKLTNIVFDKQNFKSLPNNACSFGQGFRICGSNFLHCKTEDVSVRLLAHTITNLVPIT